MTRELRRQEYKRFSKNWKVHVDSVAYVFFILERLDFKYGKASRVLKKQNFKLSPRQLKYFAGRIRLSIRLEGQHPENYSELLRKF
jgi:hypothetical protein